MTPTLLQVDARALHPAPGGGGFVMELRTEGDHLQLQLPGWLLHPLMRVLPRIDAALQADRAGPAGALGALVAYPVLGWHLQVAEAPGAAAPGVAVQLRDERHVDAAFHLALDTASALHQALGEAIAQARCTPPAARRPTAVN